jgi:hypothetical protein
MLQTILFPKAHFTKAKAIAWLMEHHHLYTKIDETANFYRFRQQTPHGGRYYTKTLPNHVELVYEQSN